MYQLETHKHLDRLVFLWVITALFGQWVFATYIGLQFAIPVFSGSGQEQAFSHMIKGYIEGDKSGNFILFAHVLPAGILSICGILQLIPYFRKHYPRFHRFNGRLFLTLGLAGALTGLYLSWVRDTRLSDIGAIGITLNGLLIPIAVFFAWKFARQKRFDLHQRWAIHAFLLVNGVWMFRLFLMGWFLVNQGPNGNNSTLDGPADIFFSFACYLLPMAFAELVFWVKRQTQMLKVHIASVLVLCGLVATIVGVVAATLMMWSPRIMAIFV